MQIHEGSLTPTASRPSHRGLRLVCSFALIAAPLGLPDSGLRAQDVERPGVPAVLDALEGTWVGSGDLLGRPAVFRMRWEVEANGFARLSFSNAWAGEDGGSTPVLSARAAYLFGDGAATGVWLDDRPQRLTLEGTTTDSSFVVNWTAETEHGRTEYVVRSPGLAVVRDHVFSNGSERLFAEATYRRRSPVQDGRMDAFARR